MWHSSNAFHPIGEVTLRRAGLILGWVTACGQVNHLSMKSAFYPWWDDKMSINFRAE